MLAASPTADALACASRRSNRAATNAAVTGANTPVRGSRARENACRRTAEARCDFVAARNCGENLRAARAHILADGQCDGDDHAARMHDRFRKRIVEVEPVRARRERAPPRPPATRSCCRRSSPGRCRRCAARARARSTLLRHDSRTRSNRGVSSKRVWVSSRCASGNDGHASVPNHVARCSESVALIALPRGPQQCLDFGHIDRSRQVHHHVVVRGCSATSRSSGSVRPRSRSRRWSGSAQTSSSMRSAAFAPAASASRRCRRRAPAARAFAARRSRRACGASPAPTESRARHHAAAQTSRRRYVERVHERDHRVDARNADIEHAT